MAKSDNDRRKNTARHNFGRRQPRPALRRRRTTQAAVLAALREG